MVISAEYLGQSGELSSLDERQWEALCDGCGKCCLHRLEDADTREIHYTNVSCRYLNPDDCRCSHYPDRLSAVPDCLSVTPELLRTHPHWLPVGCAYRLLAEGKPLPWWHPLVSGSRETVIESGNSMSGRVISELEAEDLRHHIVDWLG